MQDHVLGVPQTARFGERLCALIIDAATITIPGLIFALLMPGRLLDVVVWIALGAGYTVYFWTTSGATIGKMILGLKVVHADSGELLDTGDALLRYGGYVLSTLTLFVGFLWVLWDPERQAMHDKIAKSRVIRD
jgi:uncharacterized RDD family membrane protein YckC